LDTITTAFNIICSQTNTDLNIEVSSAGKYLKDKSVSDMTFVSEFIV